MPGPFGIAGLIPVFPRRDFRNDPSIFHGGGGLEGGSSGPSIPLPPQGGQMQQQFPRSPSGQSGPRNNTIDNYYARLQTLMQGPIGGLPGVTPGGGGLIGAGNAIVINRKYHCERSGRVWQDPPGICVKGCHRGDPPPIVCKRVGDFGVACERDINKVCLNGRWVTINLGDFLPQAPLRDFPPGFTPPPIPPYGPNV